MLTRRQQTITRSRETKMSEQRNNIESFIVDWKSEPATSEAGESKRNQLRETALHLGIFSDTISDLEAADSRHVRKVETAHSGSPR